MKDLEALAKHAATLPGETDEERWAALIEQKLVAAGEYPFSPWWWGELRRFWRTGKTTFAAGKANRAGGTTHILGMATIPEMLFRERRPFADSPLVWPNASATVDLANISIHGFASICRVLGFEEVKGRSKDLPQRLAPMTLFVSEGNRNAPGTCEVIDISGNRVEFRSQPATPSGLSGFTGTGFTADEIELWGDPVEARRVLGLGKSRLARQQGTHAYYISRLFASDGVLTTICDKGDNEGLMVARLGEAGARADEIARRYLKKHLQSLAAIGGCPRRYAEDVRLIEAADPASPIIPGWSALMIGDNDEPGPEAAIMALWRLACDGTDLEPGEDPLDGLLRVYGGRPTGSEGELFFGTEDVDAAVGKAAA